MAIVLKLENEDRLSLQEFIDHLQSTFDLEEADSLIGVAPHFRALANNPDAVAGHFNAEIRRMLDRNGESARPSSSLVFARGRNFSLQATIWMPDTFAEPLHSLSLAAGVRGAHNHNFNVMSIGHVGPGPFVDLYSFNGADCRGDIGERVDLRFTERVRLDKTRAVICRETVDVHAHAAPESLSVSISLCIFNDATQILDRLTFDTQTSAIRGHVESADNYRRASIVRLAGEVGDQRTLDLFDALLRRSPCWRTREAALTATSRLRSVGIAERRRVIGRVLKDSNESVRQRARALFHALSNSA